MFDTFCNSCFLLSNDRVTSVWRDDFNVLNTTDINKQSLFKQDSEERKRKRKKKNCWQILTRGEVQSDYRVTSKAVRASNSFDSSVFLFLSLGLCCSFGVFPRKREIPFHHAILLRQIQQTLWPSRPRWKLNVRDFSVSSDTPLVNPIRFEPDAVSYDVR